MNDEFDFESLLRGRDDELPPRADAWESIARRGRRRRRIKTSFAAAAGLCLIAGATPAILAAQHSGSEQRLQVAAPQHSNSPDSVGAGLDNPVVHPALSMLQPASVTFVTQGEGWVTGDLRVPGGTVAGGLARTTNAGATWSIEVPRPAPQGTVRFADFDQGFSFGSEYQLTDDGGLTWRELPSPGYIADLETSNGVVWALVRSCALCERLRLFQATLTAPTLVRVAAVKPIGNDDAALTLHGHAIYVTGGKDMWATTDDGYSWRHEANPCDGGDQAFSAWSTRGLAAECTPARGVGSLFESLDAGRDWTDIANVPHVQAAVGTLSAGSPDDLIITTGTGAPYVTHHHGHRWIRGDVAGAVTFASYISDRHIVGVTGGAEPAFVTSLDNGRTWTQTPFS
jgi:photosystem II stability/assembly factor-like uncharacterized protein